MAIVGDYDSSVMDNVVDDYNHDDDDGQQRASLKFSKSSSYKQQSNVDINNQHVVKYERKIVWRNVIALSTLHIIAIYYFITNSMNPSIHWSYLFIPDAIGRLSGLGILAGAHRLWAHRSYRARLPLRIFLMCLQTMALQNDIYDWCRDHRVHHKYSDTDADPYNVRRGFFFSHMGWLMVRKHPEVIRKGKTIDLSDLWEDPVVRFQRRFYIPLVIIFWAMLPTYIGHLITNMPLIECFLGTVIFRYVYSLHCTWTVNSLAHMYGYRLYDHRIEPCENFLVTYLSLGEGYHNYHHVFPWDYSASEFGWQQCFNIATAFIDLCALVGLADQRKKVDPKLIEKRFERTGMILSSASSTSTSSTIDNNNNDYNSIIRKYRQKNFYQIFIDYLFGIIISEHLILMTFALRYSLNGSI